MNDEKKVEALKRKISNWWGARNQGFVVDGFPETFNQVQLLYPKENTDVPLPDFIISLEASDQFLKERLLSTPQKNMNPLYTETGFAQALSFYRQNTTEEKSPLNFFVQYDEVVPVTVQASQKLDSLVEEVQKSVGKPRNYGPSAEELEAERMRNEKSAKEKAEKIQKEEADKRNSDLELRKKQEEEWKARTTKLQQEEQQILDLQSGPFRTYLMTNIMPLLTKGLIDVVRTRPNDPIDYLVSFFFLILIFIFLG